jgi:hypothetical protein
MANICSRVVIKEAYIFQDVKYFQHCLMTYHRIPNTVFYDHNTYHFYISFRIRFFLNRIVRWGECKKFKTIQWPTFKEENFQYLKKRKTGRLVDWGFTKQGNQTD